MRITGRGHHRLWMGTAAALGSLLLTASIGQGQTCLHGVDESRDQRARRDEAVQFVRQVNDAEAALRFQQGQFSRLHDLAGVGSPPVGFVPRMTIDAWGYAMVVKDLLDPCGFAVFSDQDAVIYEARPIAPASRPIVARAAQRIRLPVRK